MVQTTIPDCYWNNNGYLTAEGKRYMKTMGALKHRMDKSIHYLES